MKCFAGVNSVSNARIITRVCYHQWELCVNFKCCVGVVWFPWKRTGYTSTWQWVPPADLLVCQDPLHCICSQPLWGGREKESERTRGREMRNSAWLTRKMFVREKRKLK